QNIPSPGRGRSWNAPSVRNYLRRKEYYGNSKVEAIISERLFDEVQEVLEEKRVIRADDPFPMIRCDVCNGRLIYQKAGDIPRLKTSSYKCDKHTGTKPSKGRLETAPKITEEALTKIVLDRYNEYLDQATEEFESDDSRAEKVMELGEKVLKGEEIGEEYSGLWTGLWDILYNSIQNTERLLIKRFFHHMDEYDPEVGKRVIKSLRLTSDGKVKVKFWGE
ncbi:MAG: hypothetical protein IIZ80_01360, partial [Erysipelotrichaceae bacterium]|nr:hypothetical protein [Erysipelotrichaceae bacterium]